MTATLVTPRPTTSRTGLVRTGLIATVAASVATTALAAIGHAAGISLDVSGEPIPAAGFAVLTAMFSLLGLAFAVVLARTTAHARRAFLRTTVVLTALSLVPDALSDAAGGTIALLMTTHLVAAAIVIPAVARKLSA